MATKFLEPGCDATFNAVTVANGGFWQTLIGTPLVGTDFVHGKHLKSLKCTGSLYGLGARTPNAVLADAGSRISFYLYINTFGAAAQTAITSLDTTGAVARIYIVVTSGGVLQLWNGTSAKIGTNGPTLSTGRWYRISLAYTISSTTVNRFEVFVDGVSAISITNATIGGVGTSACSFGGLAAVGSGSGYDFRFSDMYIDDSNSLKDTGDVWVCAKRPNANGTTNGFTTQIGSGGSGYGTGHAPQVNERALSITNGWSFVVAGVAITEEYNIEKLGVGDFDLAGATLLDFMGWVYAKALTSETAQLVLSGANTAIALTATATMFTAPQGSAVYPPGTGADVGIVSATTATTVSLYECGVMVAFIPRGSFFPLLLGK